MELDLRGGEGLLLLGLSQFSDSARACSTHTTNPELCLLFPAPTPWRRCPPNKEIQPVHPKGNPPWIFIGRTDAEAPILRPPDAKSWLTGKDSDAGKDWGQEEKGATEDEVVGWHHRLNGHESEQTWREWRTGKPGVLQSMGLQSQTQLSDWTSWSLDKVPST